MFSIDDLVPSSMVSLVDIDMALTKSVGEGEGKKEMVEVDQSIMGFALESQGCPRMASNFPILATRKVISCLAGPVINSPGTLWVTALPEFCVTSVLKSVMGRSRG